MSRPVALTLLFVVLTFSGRAVAVAQDGRPDEVVLPRFEVAPRIDGALDDACWADAAVAGGWTLPLTDQAAPKSCEVRLGFDGAGLYLAARMAEPDPAGIQAGAPDGSSGVWKDDALEVWVRGSDGFDQFIVNAAGARQRVRGRGSATDGPPPQFPAAAQIGADAWTLELMIAWSEIDLAGPPEPGGMIQLKLGREDPQDRETTLSVWPPRAPYGAAEGFGLAFFETNNLLPNADFRAADDAGRPAGWGFSEGMAERISLVEDQGRQAVRWEAPGSYATISRSVRLEPNALYRLEAWVRGDAAMSIRARTRERASDEATRMFNVDSRPGESYAYYSVNFPTGEEGTALIILGNTEGLGAGTVYFADLAIVRQAAEETSGPAIALTPGETEWITDINIADCRALRGFVGAPVDGRLDSVAWNGSTWEYGARGAGAGVGYGFADGDGLHITLADDRGVDAVQIRGGAKVNLYRDAASYYEPGGAPIWEWRANARSSRALFGERVMSSRFSFFERADGFISDAYFFRLGEPAELPEPTTLNVQQPTEAGELAAFTGQFGDPPGEFRLLAPTRMAVQMQSAEDGWLHFVTAPANEDSGLLAVGLRLPMPGAPTGMPLEIAVMDPFNPAQRVINAECVVEGAGEVHVMLDHLDQVVPAGRPVWVAVKTGAATAIENPRVELYYAPVARALPEALSYRLWIVRTQFAALSEPRPWMGLRSRDVDLDEWAKDAYAGTKVVELLREIAFAKHLAPDDRIVQQYDGWVWQNADRAEFEPTLPQIAGAPEWAVVLRQAWLEGREVPKWWLENRLVPSGEFGGLVGDDSDMYQNYSMFPMMSDDEVARLCLQGAAALAELAEAENLEEGLNKHSTDPLHAYEEGVNHEALMTWWGYGDPVYFERSLAAARSMPALTVVTERGHRHFKNQVLGSEDLRIDRELGEDGGAHPLMLHPLVEVLWYNRQPAVERFLREWADGWLEHQQPGAYATTVDVRTEEPTGRVYTDRPLYGYGQASVFASIIQWTGDTQYLRPFMDMYAQGRAPFRTASVLPEFYQMGLLDGLSEEALDGLEGVEPYLAVLRRGDREPLLAALKRDIGHLQHFRYMYTAAEQFTDRIFLSAAERGCTAWCGGFTTRNKMDHGFAASWEGFGTDFAALVLDAGPDRLRAAVYSFADQPMEGALRVWRLDHGMYSIRTGVDTNGDDEIDAQPYAWDMTLSRHEAVPLTLAPRATTIIEITQRDVREDIRTRPDLALSPLDTTVANGAVRGVLHNLGVAGVDAAEVALVSPQGAVVARQTLTDIPGIGDDLQPVRLPYELAGVPADATGWQVIVDYNPGRGADIAEIYEGNNAVRLEECGR